jgi:hypothetical protein
VRSVSGQRATFASGIAELVEQRRPALDDRRAEIVEDAPDVVFTEKFADPTYSTGIMDDNPSGQKKAGVGSDRILISVST